MRARDSYPLGRVRTPLARPDLVNMIHLDGVLYRLKVVVLLRDLAKTVRSASRMGYHGGDVGVQVNFLAQHFQVGIFRGWVLFPGFSFLSFFCFICIVTLKLVENYKFKGCFDCLLMVFLLFFKGSNSRRQHVSFGYCGTNVVL